MDVKDNFIPRIPLFLIHEENTQARKEIEFPLQEMTCQAQGTTRKLHGNAIEVMAAYLWGKKQRFTEQRCSSCILCPEKGGRQLQRREGSLGTTA